MMIRIQITQYSDVPPSQPLVAGFDESGGSIGRGEGNTLVLHDSTRTISRTHASITFRDGGYRICNLGTAIPLYLNGQPLGRAQDAAIGGGDEISIGGYTMRVVADERPAVYGNHNPSNGSKDDPLALFGGGSDNNSAHDLFAPPLKPHLQSPSSREAKEAIGAKAGEAPIIPPDFDPFGDEPPPAPQPGGLYSLPQSPEVGDILGLGIGPSIPNQNIDRLFGLSPEKSADPFSPGNPLAPPSHQSPAAGADPLMALGGSSGQKPVVGYVQRDDVPELNGSFRPPEAKPDPALRAVPPAARQTSDAASSKPEDMVLSWENPEPARDNGEIKSVIVPSPVRDRQQAESTAEQPAIEPLEASGRSVPAAMDGGPAAESDPEALPPGRSSDLPSTPSARQPVIDRDELLRAFLEGAGVPDLAIPAGLTPQFMNILGQVLRESTQGTLDLLLARTLIKREVRAELTMIVPRENNPLKFSPGVEAALVHLLAPQGRGFMAPWQAMKDAQDDLRSHQFGFMAGMRAALAGVLERFNPEELEQRLTQKTVMDALLPGSRKAKLWDLFAEHYQDISRKAEEDFHVLFGKEFLRAYEAQIAKLEQDGKE